MLQDDQKDKIDPQERYNAPEIVCLGEVVKLTGSGDGIVIDGGATVPHWKEV